MNDNHVLVIPSAGLMEVFHTEKDIDPRGTLLARGARGQHVTFDLLVDGTSVGRVDWLTEGPVNPRARQAVVHLTGAHMVFFGPVIFTGVAPETVYEIVSTLSRKE